MKGIKVFSGIFLIYGVLALYCPLSLVISVPLGVHLVVKGLSEKP